MIRNETTTSIPPVESAIYDVPRNFGETQVIDILRTDPQHLILDTLQAASRISRILGIPPSQVLDARPYDIITDLRVFGGRNVTPNEIRTVVGQIHQISMGYTRTIPTVLPFETIEDQLCNRSILLEETTDYKIIAEKIHAIIFNKIYEHNYFEMKTTVQLNGRRSRYDQTDIPDDRASYLADKTAEEAFELVDIKNAINSLPEKVVDKGIKGEVPVKIIIKALASGQPEDLIVEEFGEEAVKFAREYFYTHFYGISNNENNSEPIHKSKYNKKYYLLGRAREEMIKVATQADSLEAFLERVVGASLTLQERAVLLHEMGYYMPNLLSYEFLSTHKLSFHYYVHDLEKAMSKLREQSISNTLSPGVLKTNIMLLEQELKIIIPQSNRHPKGSIQQIEALIKFKEEQPELFARLNSRHQLVINDCIDHYNSHGSITYFNILRISRSHGYRNEGGTLIKRACTSFLDKTPKYENGYRIKRRSRLAQILIFPIEEARKLLANNQNLLERYEWIISNTDVLHAKLPFHQRQVGHIYFALYPETLNGDNIAITSLAQKMGIPSEDVNRAFQDTLDQPEPLSDIASRLHLTSYDLYTWAKRFKMPYRFVNRPSLIRLSKVLELPLSKAILMFTELVAQDPYPQTLLENGYSKKDIDRLRRILHLTSS